MSARPESLVDAARELVQHDAQLEREPLGQLSESERLHLESPTDRALRENLEQRYDQARLARELHEEALKGVIPPEIPFEVVQDYAEKRAREALARHELERCGWLTTRA